ncbi:MAG: FAD-dependent oxidoreductase [Actinomycetota bacterium]|nr:FAD-dependent oxidoreductase [Actinomycetota bacterium]
MSAASRGGQRLVVVGHGMAASRLVEELVRRDAGYDITVIGDEAEPGYNRILLSAVLEGAHRGEDVWLRGPAWYAENGVRLVSGRRVLALDRAARTLRLSDGSEQEYDRLVLATGSRPLIPPIRGVVTAEGLHPAVHAFRSIADCRRLEDEIAPGRRAVVVGGGLLGLQVARALSVRGLRVEIVEVGPHLMGAQLSPAAARVVERRVRALGTDVYTGARGVGFSDAGLRLDNGYALSTDLLVLACGSRPATKLAQRSGLMVRRGVVVDERLQSVTDDRVHAIGDCAERRGRVHGFVGPAWEQAVVLARLLTGQQQRYDGSRVVARLRANGLDVAVLGDPEHTSGDVVEMANPLHGAYRKLVMREGVVRAAVLVGDLARVGSITQHYDRGSVLGAAEAGWLLCGDPPAGPVETPDDAEVCSCAGVTAGRIRACSDLDDAVATTRAGTGCGGCRDSIRRLLQRPPERPRGGAVSGGSDTSHRDLVSA